MKYRIELTEKSHQRTYNITIFKPAYAHQSLAILGVKTKFYYQFSTVFQTFLVATPLEHAFKKGLAMRD